MPERAVPERAVPEVAAVGEGVVRPWKVMITGGAGLLGSALCRRRPDSAGLVVEATIHDRVPTTEEVGDVRMNRVDLTQSLAFLDVLERRRPDLVIHTAYSKTDHAVTLDSTTEVATACAAMELPLIHISTDALFDGEHAPYAESDAPSPVHAYGRAKALCERAVTEACNAPGVPAPTIIRTSLVLSPDGSDGASAWIVEALRGNRRVTLFTDEIRSPILVDDLADQIWEIAQLEADERSGVWHLAGPERLSRVDQGRLLCAAFELDESLIDAVASPSTGEPRPRDVSLTSERARSLTTAARPIGKVMTHGQAF